MRKRRETVSEASAAPAVATEPAPPPPPAPVTNGAHASATSAALRDAIDKGAHQAARDAVEEAFQRPNNRAAEPRKLDPEFERIVTTLIVEHPWPLYERLEAALRIGDQRNDHGTLVRALDDAETNVRLAHRLWMTARVEYEAWRLDNDKLVYAAMREQGTRVLQQEKAQGLRNKMITDADVDAQCSILFPEQWGANEVKRKKVELMVRSMENLVESWGRRVAAIKTMLEKAR